MNGVGKHPLEITAPPEAKRNKYLQPRFKQIGPAGDGPRVIFCGQSGQGKTLAATKLMQEYLRIVDRVWVFSASLDIDPAYAGTGGIKDMIKKIQGRRHRHRRPRGESLS